MLALVQESSFPISGGLGFVFGQLHDGRAEIAFSDPAFGGEFALVIFFSASTTDYSVSVYVILEKDVAAGRANSGPH